MTVEIEVDDRSPRVDDPDADGPTTAAPDRDGDGLPRTTVTAVLDTVEDALRAADLAELLTEGVRVRPPLGAPVANGDRIEVALPATVTIAVDGEEHRVETHAERVGRVLRESGVSELPLSDPRPRPTGTVRRSPGSVLVVRPS